MKPTYFIGFTIGWLAMELYRGVVHKDFPLLRASVVPIIVLLIVYILLYNKQ